jgi:phosphoribosylformylglycinamidine synthase
MGARPIANTNVFCLAQPELPQVLGEAWPRTLLFPSQIRCGVHAGVQDGGNKSGIPTVNGAFHYDVSFAGKPLVYCGTIGVMPRLIQGRPSSEKPIQIGDHVVMVGGRIGKDGLHGATFSSMDWKEGTPASVVQIGDPLTQKRMMDFLLEARDLGLYSGITDNGAGGLSSSIGELCQVTGGAEIDLALAPTKYPGLAPWELMVSESQERMTVAVPREHLESFLHLAIERGVEATALGNFTASGVLKVKFDKNLVAELPLGFLHDGLPPMKLTARWGKDLKFQDWCEEPRIKNKLANDVNDKDLRKAILTVLSHENVRSHEAWVRGYDHEVQAATIKKPFSVFGSPCDAAIVALKPHGGSEHSGVAIASGLSPQLSRLDPWLMGVWAVDEAVRSVVCAGGDPDRLALVDNFCWPDPVASEKNPEGEKYLGMLVRTSEGLREACLAYGAPLVSGKDSMKNDAFVKVKDKNIKISALPTLLMTAIAHVEDIQFKTASFPQKENLIVLLLSAEVARIPLTLSKCFAIPTQAPGAVDLKITSRLYRRLAQAIRKNLKNLIHSVHDVSEGGVITALAESSLGEVGISVDKNLDWIELFGEAPGLITLTAEKQHLRELKSLLGEEYLQELGETTSGGGLRMPKMNLVISREDLAHAYKGGEA